MRAKKSLGQNFLNSKAIARDIARAAEIAPGDTVLEIGPGKGFLTAELLNTGVRVVAVEKDDRMIPILEEKFADEVMRGQLTLTHGDILELTGKELPFFAKKGGSFLGYKVVANIPYYITGQILRVFLEAEEKPERMILMLQKEVAERIVARDKKESILSISIKAYGAPRIIKKVHARYFTPAPKVDSAVLAIENIAHIGLPYVDTTEGNHMGARVSEERFFEIVKAGFAHKRKQLVGNLKEMFGDKTATLLTQAGIAPNARAEDVALGQWLKLASLGGSTSK